MREAAQVITFPARKQSQPVRVGLMSESIYAGIDWLASKGAYSIIREIGDYCRGFEDRRT